MDLVLPIQSCSEPGSCCEGCNGLKQTFAVQVVILAMSYLGTLLADGPWYCTEQHLSELPHGHLSRILPLKISGLSLDSILPAGLFESRLVETFMPDFSLALDHSLVLVVGTSRIPASPVPALATLLSF